MRDPREARGGPHRRHHHDDDPGEAWDEADELGSDGPPWPGPGFGGPPWGQGRRGPGGPPPWAGDERPEGPGRRGGPRGRAAMAGPGGPPWVRAAREAARMRRGDIRTALLVVLGDGPGHGYECIQRVEQASEMAWRPSPGSVYPTLQLLEDEGYVTSAERDGKRVYEITDTGRAEATRRVEEAGLPWARTPGAKAGLREAVGQLMMAAKQVGMGGNPTQISRTVEILTDARKRIYQLLAED